MGAGNAGNWIYCGLLLSTVHAAKAGFSMVDSGQIAFVLVINEEDVSTQSS